MSLVKRLITTWVGRTIIGGAIVAVVAGSVLIARAGAAPQAMEIRTASVARATITQTVAVSGSVNASAQVRVSFRSSGRLAEVLVKVGDAVKAGQPLARLDPTDLQTAVKQAEANLLSAQAKYDQTAAGASPEDIALAKNSVDTAQRTLEETRRSTANDLASAEQSFTNLKSAYVSAQNTFSLLTSAIAADVDTFTRGLRDSRAALSTAVIDTTTKSTADLTTAKNAIGQADAALVNAQAVATNTLANSLSEWRSARDNVISTWLQFDGAVQRGTDTSGATSQYRSAQQAYTAAAARLLAALDSTIGSISSAQSSISQAQNSLNSSTSKTDYELDKVRADLTGAQASLASESQLATTIKNKVNQAATSLTTITDAVGGAYVNAQQAVGTAKDKAAQAITSQENALRSAQLSFEKSTASPKSSDLAGALASLQLAQIALDKARADLDAAVLRAPVDGVVASVANQVSEAPSTPFIVVAVTSTLTLHGTVGEAEIAKLRLGQVATITVDAVGAASRMTGRATALDPVATIQQGVPVYGVDVQIDIPDRAIRPGMSGTAAVIVASKQAVLTVPNLAVRSQSGRRFVQVLRDGTPQDAEVEFGISNESLTEVVSGLEEGEQVLLPVPRASATQRPGGGGQGGPFPGGGGQGGGFRGPGVGR